MKLLIREYLSSLRERNELDILLPDLLSQMGLTVFSKPSIGNRQYGVDVAAYGAIDGDKDKVYLFSIKGGDLTRSDWVGTDQSLYPSLIEMLDVYIPTHLPLEYKDKDIVICICYGGDIKQNIELQVASFEKKHQTNKISFSRWGGEKIAGYIESYLLKEELLPQKCRENLRKSLAMLNQPEASYRYFSCLLYGLVGDGNHDDKSTIRRVRQVNICLWVLYSWCRQEGNIDSAYIGSELAVLLGWELVKECAGRENKESKDIMLAFESIINLHMKINKDYIGEVITPYVNKRFYLSRMINSSCSVDINLKLFDMLGRISIFGMWSQWSLIGKINKGDDKIQEDIDFVNLMQNHVINMINNNPLLYTPYKDEQTIEISLAMFLLLLSDDNDDSAKKWIEEISDRIGYLFSSDGMYPISSDDYNDLLNHFDRGVYDSGNYDKKDLTQASILYPTLKLIAKKFNLLDVVDNINTLQCRYLEHCTFQLWFPDSVSERYYYNNESTHGLSMSTVGVRGEFQNEFWDNVDKECQNYMHIDSISAIKYGYWPIIALASRHHRLPLPPHFFARITM